jgi:hypothetical protein
MRVKDRSVVLRVVGSTEVSSRPVYALHELGPPSRGLEREVGVAHPMSGGGCGVVRGVAQADSKSAFSTHDRFMALPLYEGRQSPWRGTHAAEDG